MLDQDIAAAALHDMLFVMLKVGAVPLFTLLVVGLAVSVFQAVTQIQEATLAFVPKLLVVGGVLVLMGPFMLGTLSDYTHALMNQVVAVGGR